MAVTKAEHAAPFYVDLQETTKKLVVFSEHPDSLLELQKKIKGKRYLITGRIPAEDRQGIVDAFNNGKEGTLLCTYKAASVGINIPTASIWCLTTTLGLSQNWSKQWEGSEG